MSAACPVCGKNPRTILIDGEWVSRCECSDLYAPTKEGAEIYRDNYSDLIGSMGSDWLELVRDLTSDGPVRVDLSRECREEYVSLRILTIATAGEICDAVEALREKNADIDLTSLEIDPTGIYFDVTIPENCVKELIAFCDGSDIIEINWDAMLDDYSASDEEGYHD